MGKADIRCEDAQDEKNLECRKEAADKLKHYGRDKRLLVLTVKCRNLAVDGVELFLMLVDKVARAFLYARNVLYQVHYPYGHALLVAFDEEPYAEDAECA